MGKVIIVAGNSGVGKTTLTAALARHAGFDTGLEQHAERPFQALMKAEPRRYGLANQIDYLLYRAEQERTLREGDGVAIVDGGLDLDYYGFTQLFHHKGYLTEAEFALCGRLYRQLRVGLGPPDLVLRLIAPPDVVARRYEQRGRALEIAARDDLALLGRLVDAWLQDQPPEQTLTVEMSGADALGKAAIERLAGEIRARLKR